MNAFHSIRRLLAVTGLGCMLLLAACGGGGGSMSSGTPPPTTTTGTAMVTLTDMPGDFLTYMVNVVSLKLTRADVPLNLPAGWDFDKVFGEQVKTKEATLDIKDIKVLETIKEGKTIYARADS